MVSTRASFTCLKRCLYILTGDGPHQRGSPLGQSGSPYYGAVNESGVSLASTSTPTTTTTLPVELFYRPWSNALGQFTFLRACQAFPDVLCLDYWPSRRTDHSLYKISADQEQPPAQIWKNLDYLQALIHLSDRGLYSEVNATLKHAFILFPDIFSSSLVELTLCPQFPSTHTAPINLNALHNSMLNQVIKYYLAPRVNSQLVLYALWNGGGQV
ncbi:unnamed protein product [Protopolystoma xenopodis]|uniref:Uncharacterized protein n=1 Tax=Protopolystoma xenopodis TaxID=117903 RepID=A0A3S5BAF1_9PLAT|nr:unnamed protein product [Protopolystoma xenopodis]